MARAIKKYVYRTCSAGKCGCKSISPWMVIEAESKAEIRRRYKTIYNTVEIMTAEELRAIMEKNPGTRFRILGDL